MSARGSKRLARSLAAVVALFTAVPLLAQKSSEKQGNADRVFVNGRIFTADPARPLAEALAVRGQALLEVGTSAAIRSLAGKGTDVVDLRGRFVAPGFIDAHLHLVGGSLSLEELRLDDAETFGAVSAAISAWARAHPEALWVTGKGWSYAAFPGGLPTRTQLDALVPDRPAYLSSYDGHTGWANSAALRLAEITRWTKDPAGGTIVRDAKGEPTGALKEDSAQDLVERLLPKRLPHELERALRRGIEQAAAWGLTGVHQAGIPEDDLAILAKALETTPRLRVYAALPMDHAAAPAVLAQQDELRKRFATPRLRVGAVKGYLDGVVEASTAAMFDSYPSGGTGLPRFTQEELDRAVAAYDKAGWQVMLHAIGDRSIDMALTAFERAARANRTTGRRHRVEHVEVPRLADLPRFKALGVVASTQAMFPYPNANHLTAYVPALGPERARRALAFKAIDDSGATQAFGSDWPVFTADVVRGIAAAVTRTTLEGTPAGGWEPGQRLAVEAALRHFTRDAAYAEHAEQERGVLAKGRLADFVVLSQDLLTLPPERIKDTKVLLTVLGGQDTFRAQGF